MCVTAVVGHSDFCFVGSPKDPVENFVFPSPKCITSYWHVHVRAVLLRGAARLFWVIKLVDTNTSVQVKYESCSTSPRTAACGPSYLFFF